MGFIRHLFVIAATSVAVACSSLPIEKHSTKAQNKRVQSLVLHFTAGNYRNSMFALKQSGHVSSHYLVPSLEDDTYPYDTLKVIQLVDETDRAWHAGYSHWQGRDNLNDTSIGIEIVHKPHCKKIYSNTLGGEYGPNQVCEFPDFDAEQMALLVELVKDILSRHPDIEETRIVGHSDIAPQRKSDPGPRFPWQQLAEAGIGAWFDAETFDLYQHMFALHPPSLALTQKALRRYGYKIKVTGEWDQQTQDVLLAFQSHFNPSQYGGGLTVDTNAALFSLLEKYAEGAVEPILSRYFNEANLLYAGPPPLEKEQKPSWVLNREAFYGVKGQGQLQFSSELIERGQLAINGRPLDLNRGRNLDLVKKQLDIGQWVRDGRNVLTAHVPASEANHAYQITGTELINTNNEWLKRRFSPLTQLSEGADLVVGYKGQILVNSQESDHHLLRDPASGNLANHMATQITTLQLLEQGILQTNAPVSDYLTDYSGQGREFRTLSHLLNHTSGYPREFNIQRVRENLAEFQLQNGATTLKPRMTNAELVRQYLPFAYGLNARQEYSPVNDQLMAMIIRSQIDQPLSAHIEQTLIEPLQLRQSVIRPPNHALSEAPNQMPLQIDASALDLAKLGQLALNQGRYGDKKWWSYGQSMMSTNPLSECDLYAGEKVLFVLDHQYGFVLVDEAHHLVMANLYHQPQPPKKTNKCGLAPSQAELINMTYQMLYQLQSSQNES